MQIFTNGKRRFHSFTEFFVIHLKKNQEVIISVSVSDYSGTLKTVVFRFWCLFPV